MQVLKCWNGIYGCCSFEIIGWQYDFNNINEAKEYYEQIWTKCWVEEVENMEE